MKQTFLSTLLIAAAALTLLPSDASAYYHAQMGRFINRDPIGYGDGVNAYGYVQGNPTTHLAPSGLVRIACACRQLYYPSLSILPLLGSPPP